MVLSGAAAAATGMMVWAIHSSSAAAPESKAQPAPKKTLENVDALLQTGVLQQQTHDSKGAARTYRRVLELDPQNKLAWYNLGVIAHEDGRTADARAAYEKSLKIDPAFESALFNEALLLKSSDPDRAMGLLERAIGANPQATTAHLHLADIWAKKNRDEEAADEYRRAVAADPSLRSHVPESFRDSLSPSPEPSPAGSTR
ncbi:Tetratricopeptide repeat protein OS=Streptomyces aurantiogriseus OX=66870 GN=GCM10010251_16990 PE=4 SV=1 [Streptomyces aurantiogriseus]|uniref:Tetratricopeptide repeat protein n=2 Tax=Streptomyces aurantiogriseus TaxID=66870 RepID=A0A918C2C4_9ACTN|nr:hypothetical protein GCM10010251_16990 [Streptomyces aurantiogriseus]